ncbi:PREDICTED: uncharacterized protein LOC105560060 isoform X2 [Vollenhovia emeryi]|uniref:uncharacterized protein LOC105560060 isoform X2 n=1 Tax=Vollenhovia emeryi TaxID=411798 RepID=UPI0005F3AAAD|nr:PREDICTED: uncharacterized protein LOC105560060 isoform X2 [Vollenhovia emeryi]
MICVKSHFKFNRILLLSIGLWPYERTKLVQLQAVLVFILLSSSVIHQLATLVFTKCTSALIINVLSIALYFSTFAILYHSFWINNDAMKWLLDKLQHICNDLKDEKEIAIIIKYGNIAKRLTALFTLCHVCNISSIILLSGLLYFLEAVLFVEESDSYHFFQKGLPKFIIGRENCTYLITLHFFGAGFIGGTAVLAVGMMLVSYFKHVCGIFRIASYRIEKAMAVNMLKNISLENEIIICKEIVHAVDIHRKAIKISTLLFSTFNGPLSLLLLVFVICLSFNLYRISESISRENNIEQCLIHFVIIIGIFLFLFVTNYIGQEMTDYNNHVFFTVYNVRWYVAPLHVQRLILFLLQNGSKAFHLCLGGMFSGSIELFATLTKASLSYFTVVYSMQH